MVLSSGEFGLNAMVKFLTKCNWHDSKVKYLIWNNLIMYAKVAWERVQVKNATISAFRPRLCSKVSTKHGVLKTFVVGEIR